MLQEARCMRSGSRGTQHRRTFACPGRGRPCDARTMTCRSGPMSGAGCLVGAVLLAGCLDEHAVTTTAPGDATTTTGATGTTADETSSTTAEIPTTSMPPLMTTDVSTTT